MKIKNKSKALKSTPKKDNGFFRALFFGFVTCLLTWIVLSLVFALIMSKQNDSTALGKVLTPVIVVVSLAAGGFVAGKTDKSCAGLSSFVLGTVVLGISYALSTVLDISGDLGAFIKTVEIAVMLVCPVIGAKLSLGQTRKKTRRRK